MRSTATLSSMLWCILLWTQPLHVHVTPVCPWRARQHCKSVQLQNRLMLQAKKEGNAEIAGKLEEALRTAMAEKQKHLRPEIRLLNELMQIHGDSQRQKVGHLFSRFRRPFIRPSIVRSQPNLPCEPDILCNSPSNLDYANVASERANQGTKRLKALSPGSFMNQREGHACSQQATLMRYLTGDEAWEMAELFMNDGRLQHGDCCRIKPFNKLMIGCTSLA